MSKFRAGDRVRRTHFGENAGINHGDEVIVDSVCPRTGWMCIPTSNGDYKGLHVHDPANYELVTTPIPSPDSKPTNPKDAIGDSKLDYSVIPSTVLAFLSTAFFEGAAKYGKLNWRHCGVRGSVYTNALERHLQKYIGGEFVDPETGVPHLASVMACAGIILDAGIHGKLTDDRPNESPESVALIPNCAAIQQKLKAMHKDKNPIHYTKDRNVTK